MHFLLLAFFLFTPSIAVANAMADDDFRVSGIMRLGGDNYRGLLEFSNREKRMVAVGESVGQWSIDSISEYCLVLSRQNKKIKRCLAGSPETEQMSSEVEKTDEKVEKSDLSGFKQGNKIDLLQALDSIKETKSVSMEELSSAILPLFFSRQDLSIIEIDAQKPKSVEQAIATFKQAAEQEGVVRLTIKDEKGTEGIVYLQVSP